ncbi:MAG TPA: ATP-binding protein [Bryobacteraceae bacterium]|nr:ATP-binding protein [Bryobacteraceae bacterium]
MFPQFQRVVTLSVMSILVGLFYWIYQRDRQERARLWMLGWSAIVAHFAGMLLSAFHLIPARLSDWLAYVTLILGVAAFSLSMRTRKSGPTGRTIFWAGLIAPAIAYWTLMVYEVQSVLVYRMLLLAVLTAGGVAMRHARLTPARLVPWLATLAAGLFAFYRVGSHVESGIDFILFAGFALTGLRYWRYFHRFSPGVLLTSLSFLAWGSVFPVAELCAALGINIPGDHVVWDLPKYFVAFGMIVTLFENQTEILQVQIGVRQRAEKAAQAANEAKSILMASVSFAARRMLSAAGWETVILETLSKMGVAARVSRAYVAEVHLGESGRPAEVLHEWSDRTSEMAHAAAADWYRHINTLLRGEVVTLSSWPQGSGGEAPKSVILVPIEVGGEWFGFLGFEDYRQERGWSQAERDSFRSAARMLGASITRQRAQDYVDNILTSMEEALLVLDPDLQIQRVNPSALRLLGYAEEELIGRPARQIILERETPCRRSAVERTYRTKAGQSIPVLFSAAEMRDSAGDLNGYVWLAQDMTELKRVQGELVRAKEAAEAANRAKSTFLANMSHELRTPLNAVIGYSEMLQEVLEDRGEKDLLPDLNRIRSAGTHLLGLINDVLDLSKIEAGKLELTIEAFPVSVVLHDVASSVHPLVEKNGNRLAIDCAEPLGCVVADLTRFRQVLMNLLSNACKFTEQGTIRLAARRVWERSTDWLELQVQDTGIGMSQDQLERLFQPFVQADASTTRKYGGTGLGLTISHEYCQMMGGSLTAKSELGAGSIFTVRLPAAQIDDLAAGAVEGRVRTAVHA